MTLRQEVVEERLLKLREVLRNLEKVRAVDRETFLSSFEKFWLAERGLQLAAEIVFDIGTHLLSAVFNDHPSRYEDVTRLLMEHGVLTEDLRERLTGLGGFRNILVHAYLDLDESRVYEFLQDDLGSFSEFAEQIERFLDTHPDASAQEP